MVLMAILLIVADFFWWVYFFLRFLLLFSLVTFSTVFGLLFVCVSEFIVDVWFAVIMRF